MTETTLKLNSISGDSENIAIAPISTLDKSRCLDNWFLTSWFLDSQRSFEYSKPKHYALSCFLIARYHFSSIIDLCEVKKYPSAFALLRPLLETFLRGCWILRPKNTEMFSGDFDGVSFPSTIDNLIQDIETNPEWEKYISNYIRPDWSTLCGYTHTGLEQLQHFGRTKDISAVYEDNEIDGALNFAAMVMFMASSLFAECVGDQELLQAVRDKVIAFVPAESEDPAFATS
jgi:hypothetical protein